MRISYRPVEQLPGSDQSEAGSGHHRDTITTAWVVLSISFAVFIVLVIGAFVGAKRYYDTASVPRSATLSIDQGIVLFRDAVSSTLINAHDGLELREGDELLVGQGTRASIATEDGSMIQLYPGSRLTLQESRKSRFHDGFTRLAVGLEAGTARLLVSPFPTKDSQFLVSTPFGYGLLTKGSFGVAVEDGHTRISSREGTASVFGKPGSARLRAGEKVLLSKTELSGPIPEGDQLVVNGNLSQGFARWSQLQNDEPGRPVEPGERMLVTQKIGGRDAVALRATRVSPLGTHGEIGLTQAINKDVSDYQSLQLSADVRVDEQSLSGGGYMGYEYPLMIRVHYRDETGGQIDWTHGFFFKNTEARPTPNGQEVAQGQWISYSTDLMEAQPKPLYIISVDVLGAGHTFAGMVTNVGLVGK